MADSAAIAQPRSGKRAAALTLAALGVVMSYSAGASQIARGEVPDTLAPELFWVTLGVAVMLITSRIDYRFLRLVSVSLLLVALVLLVIVLWVVVPAVVRLRHRGTRHGAPEGKAS